MPDRENVIEGLQKCAAIHQGFVCESCEYPGNDCAVDDAIALLKAQEPRVMTLEELQTAENCMEPVFLEIRDERSTPDVFSWRIVKHITPMTDKPIFVLDCVGFSSALYTESYGYLWRCWTSRPTEAEREAVKWE